MPPYRPWLPGLVVAGLLGVAAKGQPAPEIITSDEPSFCMHLQDRVDALWRGLANPTPEVDRLREEGAKLCSDGHARAGIQRLRRAYMLMSQPDQTDDFSIPANAPPPATQHP